MPDSTEQTTKKKLKFKRKNDELNGDLLEQMRNTVLKDDLMKFIRAVELLQNDKDEINEALKDVFTEARQSGVDVKVLREVLKLRKMDPTDFQDWEITRTRYLNIAGPK